MKPFINKIASDKILRLSTLLSCMLLLVHALYVVFVYRFLPPFVPMFNQLPWGDARLGTRPQIILPFLIGISVLIINILVIIRTYDKIPLIGRILSVTTFLICLLALIFIFRTTQLVI